MAINWTNNGTNNKWGENTTARFEATGDLPSWVTSGQIDGDAYYVTSDGTTTKATGINDGAVYSNGKLTITVNISMDMNDWTVQVFGTNSSNVLRWPGFGAVSYPWADPGCQADDAESGDLTHKIVRTYEQQNGDNWSTVSKIDQFNGDTYRITYNVTDGNLNAQPVTRIVTFPLPEVGTEDSFIKLPGDNDPTPVKICGGNTDTWGTLGCNNRSPRYFPSKLRYYVLKGSANATGNMLPLSRFYLDDPGFIIPPVEDVNNPSSIGRCPPVLSLIHI